MRQAVIPRHGNADVFEMRESPDPVPGDGQIRIRVRAAGINFADILARMGLYPDAPKPPVVVGYEVSGVVDAVGPSPRAPDGARSVRAPRAPPRRVGGRFGALTRFGGYADRVVVPEGFAFPIPGALEFVDAAAIPVNYLT